MLKDYRMECTDFTQEKMAYYLNMSLSTYRRIEKKNDCDLSIAKSISTLFGDTIENIFFK